MSTPGVPGDPLAKHSSTARELKARLEAERTGIPFIAFRDPEGSLQIVHLAATALTIGRDPETDIAVTWDTEVSGLHAELQRIGREWAIVDDGLSRNGTFVNGRRVSGRHRLRDQDRIRVGRSLLVFQGPSLRSLDATRVPSAIEPTAQQLSDVQRQTLLALCRPLLERGDGVVPASNRQIADELYVSEQSVKARLRQLFDLFGLDALQQNQKRATLASHAVNVGLVSVRDLPTT